ncbi:MAG: UDP-N-acetylglucosamine 1-carboxyvinyltransferase [Rickettsiales bacterium]|nr:MAG: UDP-N-acetylglucosamine 1-carboxyvinyltransferase [Rickettsiales bacterium]
MPVKKIVVQGGNKLVGEVKVSGAKNSVLKMICASILLKKGELTLHNVPNITDVTTLSSLLNSLGASITLDSIKSSEGNGKTIIINTENVDKWVAPYEIVSQMRATFIVLGPLISRFGKAKVSLPGGCVIGSRALDIHFDALRKMDIDIEIDDGYVIATAKNGRPKGADIEFRFASVGATENVMFTAILADGITTIHNAAKEPDIVDIANCLNAMGAKISGAGTETMIIEGVKELHSAEWTTMGDKIEAGSFIVGALLTDGDLKVSGIDIDSLKPLLDKVEEMGAEITKIDEKTIRVKRGKNELKPVDVVTDIWPGFPTDLQAPMMTLLANVNGVSSINETIFENRFMHVSELNRLNANIKIENNKAIIDGSEGCYRSATVMASDLRAGMALVLAGIAGTKKTTIRRFYHIERGYEFVDRKLQGCGIDARCYYE